MTEPAEPTEPETRQGRSLRAWAILVVLGLVTAVVAWMVATSVIPRWWAQRIGDVIDGRITAGTVFGLSIGALFTLVPLTVLALGWRFRRTWKRALGFLVVAMVLATPNLATLGIVTGTGNAAHAGQRILDVEGPGFRGGSFVGAVLAFVAFLAITALARSRRRNRARTKALQAELAARDA